MHHVSDVVKLYDFINTKVLNEDVLVDTTLEINLPVQSKLNKNSRHKISLSESFDILFTILNPDPDLLDVTFDIQKAIEGIIIGCFCLKTI